MISREALLQSHKLKVVQSQVALALEESAIDICLQVTEMLSTLQDRWFAKTVSLILNPFNNICDQV